MEYIGTVGHTRDDGVLSKVMLMVQIYYDHMKKPHNHN